MTSSQREHLNNSVESTTYQSTLQPQAQKGWHHPPASAGPGELHDRQ